MYLPKWPHTMISSGCEEDCLMLVPLNLLACPRDWFLGHNLHIASGIILREVQVAPVTVSFISHLTWSSIISGTMLTQDAAMCSTNQDWNTLINGKSEVMFISLCYFKDHVSITTQHCINCLASAATAVVVVVVVVVVVRQGACSHNILRSQWLNKKLSSKW